MNPRRLPSNARKLLVASVGVASVSYVVACGSESSGNLVGPPEPDASADVQADHPTSGNLAPPPDAGPHLDAGQDSGWDATSGNLVAPDAGNEDATTDAADAETE
jgi:hypothetical protein